MRFEHLLVACLSAVCLDAHLDKQTAPSPDTLPIVDGLAWRNIGPARGGHVADLAVPAPQTLADPPQGTVIYAAGPGGLFKTTDGGEHWMPLFDRESVAAVNAVAVSPSDPNVVWAGTGFPNFNFTPVPGRGVFRSVDGGQQWVHVGLTATEYISRIVGDPRDSGVAYAAALGSFSAGSQDRGVYKTIDGGRTWSRVLFVDQWTGAVDLAMDPADPATLYAATYQRAGALAGLIDYGPGSGIYKTADGGATWRKLTRGLPSVPMGRIGIATTKADPALVYAAIMAPFVEAGARSPWVAVYRSLDRGETWQRMGRPPSYAHRDDFGRIEADPTDARRIYVGGVGLDVSQDGGETFTILADSVKGHLVDQHAIWIHPTQPAHLIVGNDRGVWTSRNRGESWSHSKGLALAQYFSIAAERESPFYRVYGSMRDQWGYGGPVRTRDEEGIRSHEWRATAASEIFGTAVDTPDGTTVYGGDGAGVVRFDVRSDRGWLVGPYPAFDGRHEPMNPWGPIVVSPHEPRTIYTATTRVWKSTDRGDHWLPISHHLSPEPSSVISLMGLSAPRTGGFVPHTVRTVAVSALERGVLYAGTEDGIIAISRNDGDDWRVFRAPPGVPPAASVTRIVASSAIRGVAYISLHALKAGDSRPYLLRSSDYGGHFTRIDATLPTDAAMWTVVEHPSRPSLLFIATDRGVFWSADGGVSWRSLRLNMPSVRVTDLLIQPQVDDLVAATWGRGLFVLDQITAIETLDAAERRHAITLFPVVPAVRFTPRARGFSYAPEFAAPNPPYGALLSYYVPHALTATGAVIEIRRETGDIVRQLEVPLSPGLHRVSWDLRWDGPAVRPTAARRPVKGPLVRAGTYHAQFTRSRSDTDGDGLGAPQPIVVVYDAAAGERPSDLDEEETSLLRAHRLLERCQKLIEEAQTLERRAGAASKEREAAHRIARVLGGSDGARGNYDRIWPTTLVLLHQGGIYEDYPPLPPALATRNQVLDQVERQLNAVSGELAMLRDQVP